MTELNPHAVDPADEGRHTPGDEPLWNESPYLDFVSGDGSIAGYARIGLYPNLGTTWWTTAVVGPGRPLVTSVAYDLPIAPEPGFTVESGGYAFGVVAGVPLDSVTLGATVPATAHDDPLDVYRGAPGRPAAPDRRSGGAPPSGPSAVRPACRPTRPRCSTACVCMAGANWGWLPTNTPPCSWCCCACRPSNRGRAAGLKKKA